MSNKIQHAKRIFRPKNPTTKFLCPLCGIERGLRYRSKLNITNYMQIIIISLVVTLALYPIMQFKSTFSIFIIWGAFEYIRKINFRREIPCPECGFDATWYKRDVKIARKLVVEFQKKIREQNPEALEENNTVSINNSKFQENNYDNVDHRITDGLLATLKDPVHTETSA